MNPEGCGNSLSAGSAAESGWETVLAARQKAAWQPWSAGERAELIEFNRHAGAPEAVLGNIECLAQPDCLVLIAGQQAGILLSPLLVLYKAAAAILHARVLSKRLNQTVIPVFWIASEDHDFEEVRDTVFIDREGRLARWRYEPRADFPERTSVFDIPFEPERFEEFFHRLESEARPGPYLAETLATLRLDVADSADLEIFFAKQLMRLLGAWGLIALPSRLPTLRRRARPILEQEIRNPLQSTRLVRDAALAGGGINDQALHRRGDEVNFFLYRGKSRCKLTCREDRFLLHATDGTTHLTAEDLLAELDASPGHFSCNVVTRPIVQDLALPVLGMVAGPGERRYLAQLDRVYGAFGVTRSRVLARPRALLVEPRLERLLARYAIGDEALRTENWQVMQQDILRSGAEASGVNSVEDLLAQLHKGLTQRAAAMGELADHSRVRRSLDRTRRATRRQLERFEHLLLETLRERDDSLHLQTAKLGDALFPEGLPQERIQNAFFPYGVEFGPLFVEWFMQNFDPSGDGLQIMRLAEIHH